MKPKRLKILNIIGTRPEAVKLAPVLKELNRKENASSVLCVTGQHREMVGQVLNLFEIPADYDLDVMEYNQDLTQLTATLLCRMGPVIKDVKPDWIVAQGDTTSVLAGALSAYYHHIPFAHVEAGLRTGVKFSPFPEEMNRRLADCLADILFAPTKKNRDSLIREGINPHNIYVTGNTVIDAVLSVAKMPFKWKSGPLSEIPFTKKIVLVTAHRRESFGVGLEEICGAIRVLAERFSSRGFVFAFPVHPNPNVTGPVTKNLSEVSNIHLLNPLDYLSFVHLMKRSALIMSDSGGLQEEALSFGIPVIVMRDVTERTEGIEAGGIRLVGTKLDRIVNETATLLENSDAYEAMKVSINPFGDGHAAGRIVAALFDAAASRK